MCIPIHMIYQQKEKLSVLDFVIDCINSNLLWGKKR